MALLFNNWNINQTLNVGATLEHLPICKNPWHEAGGGATTHMCIRSVSCGGSCLIGLTIAGWGIPVAWGPGGPGTMWCGNLRTESNYEGDWMCVWQKEGKHDIPEIMSAVNQGGFSTSVLISSSLSFAASATDNASLLVTGAGRYLLHCEPSARLREVFSTDHWTLLRKLNL